MKDWFEKQVYKIYQSEGKAPILKLGEILRMPEHWCGPCDCLTPAYRGHCLVCSSEFPNPLPFPEEEGTE